MSALSTITKTVLISWLLIIWFPIFNYMYIKKRYTTYPFYTLQTLQNWSGIVLWVFTKKRNNNKYFQTYEHDNYCYNLIINNCSICCSSLYIKNWITRYLNYTLKILWNWFDIYIPKRRKKHITKHFQIYDTTSIVHQTC